MTQKKNKKEHKKTSLNEPLVNYKNTSHKKKMIISSLQEQEEDNYDYWLSLTPIQRLQAHYQLIKIIYKDQLKNNKDIDDKIIIIDEYPH